MKNLLVTLFLLLSVIGLSQTKSADDKMDFVVEKIKFFHMQNQNLIHYERT